MSIKISKSIILSLLLVPLVLSLELKIVDEDYVQVYKGGRKTPLKLLIDPVGHFTYIFKKTDSITRIDQLEKEYSFHNTFGTFKGKWETDFIFMTPDEEFGFRLNYLYITESKDSVLKVDGVLGLGYADDVPANANIYKILSSMSTIFKFKNVMTYDKKNSRIVLGSTPNPDSFNPVPFNLTQPDGNNPVNLVKLNKIGFYKKGAKLPDYIDVDQNAKFGLIPVIIAPYASKDLLMKQIVPKITNKPDSIKPVINNDKFFDDIEFTEPNDSIKDKGVFLFGKVGYKFAHTWEEKGKYTSAIRIGDDTADNYWYIGIDKLDVNRMDFDFDNKKVTLFSPSASEIGKTKYPYLFVAILCTILGTIILSCCIRKCCFKIHQKDIKEGEELAFL